MTTAQRRNYALPVPFRTVPKCTYHLSVCPSCHPSIICPSTCPSTYLFIIYRWKYDTISNKNSPFYILPTNSDPNFTLSSKEATPATSPENTFREFPIVSSYFLSVVWISALAFVIPRSPFSLGYPPALWVCSECGSLTHQFPASRM